MTGGRNPHAQRDTHVPARGDVPAYTLRLSDRARSVRLTMTPRDGLVVVVPRSLRAYDPSTALQERRDWIEYAHARVAERRAALLAGADALLPSDIVFSATAEHWRVEYRASDAATVSARVRSGLLVVAGNVDDGEACLAALRRWLQRAAGERLLPLLARHAELTGLSYRRAMVRGQRRRWGGYSTSGTITLNRCLVFLPSELATAVVLHELAHLREPNHSKEFWAALEALDPNAGVHRRAIAHAWDAVPPWAEP